MMKPNPGGEIPTDEIIGREQLIRRLWQILARQSLVLTAERRMGKTCVIKKMRDRPEAGFVPLYRDIEKVHTTLEFVETVLGDVRGQLSVWGKTGQRVQSLMGSLSGFEIGGIIKIPERHAGRWKTLLTTTMEDLAEHQVDTVILFWDELPLMLGNIIRSEGERAAMELLDTLRSLRQMHGNIRMVFTGSVGLHHVVAELKRQGYVNPSTNDMLPEDVPPLDPEEGRQLALRLVRGARVGTHDPDALASTIASAVDCVPFYIHHVVDQLMAAGRPAGPDDVEQIVAKALSSPQDQWELSHYFDRIEPYFGSENKGFVLAILDALAVQDGPMRLDDLFNAVKSQIATSDLEKTRNLLNLLQRDHYLLQDPDGRFRFRLMLIRRWWQLRRGLNA